MQSCGTVVLNDHRLKVHQVPNASQRYERLIATGVRSFSDAELLALVLDKQEPEDAQHLLNRHGGLSGIAQTPPTHWAQCSTTEALRLAAAIEIGRRIAAVSFAERPIIENAETAAKLVEDMGYLQQEHVRLILLDANRRLSALPTLYMGTVSASVTRVAEILREAIAHNSPAFILAHNHPSGDPSPSPEDIDLTQALLASGKLLDIQCIDHLIIGQGKWVSLRQLGFL
jgi:DNA repair protein RadC